MATINLDIIFPDPTSTLGLDPVVSQNFPVAKQFDRINWTVYAVNKDVKKVEIEFKDPTHTFFGALTIFDRDFQGKGKTTIYGEVPDLSLSSPVSAKYTVRGFDSGNALVSELDPEIIVDEP